MPRCGTQLCPLPLRRERTHSNIRGLQRAPQKRAQIEGSDPGLEAPAPGDHRRARDHEHTPSPHSHPSEKNKKMIRYIDLPTPARTRSVSVPSGGGIDLRSDAVTENIKSVTKNTLTVTENTGSVTEIPSAPRGRPRKPDALTPAERQRRYRERKRTAV